MLNGVLLSGFIIAVGLCVAGAGTHFYQWRVQQQAMLRYDGSTALASLGHVVMSLFCGPYIMLQMGWKSENGTSTNMTSALLSAVVAFGWAFITGLVITAAYVSIRT